MPRAMGTVSPRVCDPTSDESLDTLIDLASTSSGWVERNARYLLDKVDALLKAGTWPRRLEGEPRTWERFCAEVLGYPAAYIEHLRMAVCALQEQGVHSATLDDALLPEQAAALRDRVLQQWGR